jgi:hypothetical protein
MTDFEKVLQFLENKKRSDHLTLLDADLQKYQFYGT